MGGNDLGRMGRKGMSGGGLGPKEMSWEGLGRRGMSGGGLGPKKMSWEGLDWKGMS